MSHVLSDIRNIEYAKKTENATIKIESMGSHYEWRKTEEFTMKRNGEETWKKCKLLDTGEDVKR